LAVAVGNHSITARAVTTGQNSNTRNFTRETTLVYELTDFENRTFGGWQIGPAASDPRDWSIRLEQGNYRLFNNTFTNNSAGVVLKKSFSNFEIGRRYEFSILAVTRFIGGNPNVPTLSLSTSQGALTQPTPLPRTWITLSGQFVAQSKFLELRISNHMATHDGNDYEIDNLLIRAI